MRRVTVLTNDAFPVDLDRLAAAAAMAEVSVAAISLPGYHAETFAVTADGTLRHRWHVHRWADWATMDLPPGHRAAHVGGGSHGTWVDLFVITVGGALLHRYWHPHDGWSGWESWGTGYTGPVALASGGDDHIEVWVRLNSELVHQWLVGSEWSGWHPFG